MKIPASLLDRQEVAALRLRQLYAGAGYSRYRMSRFEPYDLYARNKDYLQNSSILTFSDMRGQLLAMRPDVTLSIVKAYRGEALVQFQYHEHVYRPGPEGDFREIMQCGLECLGQISQAETADVLLLAARSLEALGEDWALSLSHTGIAQGFADSMSDEPRQRQALMEAIAGKHVAALNEWAGDDPHSPLSEGLQLLLLLGQDVKAALERILQMGFAVAATQQLLAAWQALSQAGYAHRLRLDFSQDGSRRYYDGILFRGYLMGLPERILSGGRYDPLMRRMGKEAGGIGFAVYLDQLDYLSNEEALHD